MTLNLTAGNPLRCTIQIKSGETTAGLTVDSSNNYIYAKDNEVGDIFTLHALEAGSFYITHDLSGNIVSYDSFKNASGNARTGLRCEKWNNQNAYKYLFMKRSDYKIETLSPTKKDQVWSLQGTAGGAQGKNIYLWADVPKSAAQAFHFEVLPSK